MNRSRAELPSRGVFLRPRLRASRVEKPFWASTRRLPRRVEKPFWASTRRLPRRPSAGFTLVEVMLVLAILALAASVVYLRIEGLLPHWELRSSVRRVASTVAFARSQAIVEGRPVILRYQTDVPECEVIRRVAKPSHRGAERLLQTPLGENVKMEIETPHGLNGVGGHQVDIVCAAAGTLTPHTVRLVGADGATVSLNVNPLTGRTHVQWNQR